MIAVREYASAEEMLAAYRARLRPAMPLVFLPQREKVSLKPRSGLCAPEQAAIVAAIKGGQSYSRVAKDFGTTIGVVAGILRRAGGRNG